MRWMASTLAGCQGPPDAGDRSPGLSFPPMNLLDLLLLGSLLLAALGGYRLGLLARASSWAGFGVGVLASVWTVRTALLYIPDGSGTPRLLIAFVVLVMTVGITSTIGQLIGMRLRGAVHATPLRGLDHLGGLVAGVAGVLLLVWFLLPAATQVPGTVSRQVRSSVIAAAIQDLTPRPPDALQTFRALIDQSRFPEVFDDLRPAPDLGPPPSEIPVPQEVVERVTASTVNVEATGCGRRYEGSGFAIRENLIVTNAHVVAGADEVDVRRPDGEVLSGRVVVFDDDRDLALVRVDGLGQAPLPLARASEGQDAVEVGYPGGQDTPRPQPASVRQIRNAVGRDIYGQDRTEREVLFLSARLAQGDSGAPVADAQGAVIGVVFAISPDRDTTAYAVTSAEVQAVLDAPREPTTGRCL